MNRSEQGPNHYIRVCSGPQRDRYVHDLIAEAALGRDLRPEETVEHVDGNCLNCDWRNLQVVDRATNTRLMLARHKKKPLRYKAIEFNPAEFQ